MENKFKSFTIFEFQERFPDDNACYEYLIELKWKDGFVCPFCGHIIAIHGVNMTVNAQVATELFHQQAKHYSIN